MNKSRRTALLKLQDRIESIQTDLESLRDEEQDAFDNLSESQQESERRQDMEAGLSELNDALDALDQTHASLTNAIGDQA